MCNGPIEIARLKTNPLLRVCLLHFTSEDRQKFEQDRPLVSAVRREIDTFLGGTASGCFEDEFFEGEDRAIAADRGASERPKFDGVPAEAPGPIAVGRPRFGSRVMLALNAAWRVFLGRIDDHVKPYPKDDMDRAVVVQSKMLPGQCLRLGPWDIYFKYNPLLEVGGDYCDLIPAGPSRLFFFLGDAVGKGISASLIASQLHALFRALVSLAPFEEMAERANRIFCESMATGHYATVVCGHALPDGKLELVNAGHPPPLLLRAGQVTKLEATGLPLGPFYTSKYDISRIQLEHGETLLFYTDGVTEAQNSLGVQYGCERLARLASARHNLIPEELVHTCLSDLSFFTNGSCRSDDITMMARRHH